MRVAMPSSEMNPTISVIVVKITPPASAGSILNLAKIKGRLTPLIAPIIKLINNPIDSRFMGKEGISRVKKLFNMEKAVFNTEECIDQVIKTYV